MKCDSCGEDKFTRRIMTGENLCDKCIHDRIYKKDEERETPSRSYSSRRGYK